MKKWFCLGLLLMFVAPLVAGDWPQWRGPGRDGRSAETGLLASWPAEGPPLEWSASGLGVGYSSLAVAGERIYTLGDIAGSQYALAISRSDGSPLWKTRIGPVWEDKYPGPRSTPTVDGDRVFVLGTEGDLVALDAAAGKVLWQRNLVKDFGGTVMKAQGSYEWKFSESPLVDGDRVIVTPGAKDAGLVALRRSDGKEIWRSAMPAPGERGVDGAGYASAVISNAGGVRQYVQLTGRGVIGVAADSGRLLWNYDRIANEVANIPTPLIDGSRVFVSTGYGAGSALLELSATGYGVAAREAYFLSADTMQNHHGGMILDKGTIYAGTGHNKGFPLAVRLADGEIAWGPVRNEGKGSAAVSWADGRLYFRYQDGRMVLIEATPDEYREQGSFMIPDVQQFSWAHPVIAGGRLYLREQDRLYVYDVRRPETRAKTDDRKPRGIRLPAPIRRAVEDPLRPEDDRARDADRRPGQVLEFFGIRKGQRVADLQATRGYYTELLSNVVGDKGVVYAQNNDFVLTRFAGGPLAERLERLRAAGRDNIVRVDAELDEMELPAGLDAAVFVRFYHDLFWLPKPDGNQADRKEFLRRVFEALKPGGVFGVVDHHAEAGSGDRDALDPRQGLHRIDVELVKREVLAAGFVLDGDSDVLSDPADSRDWNIFVDGGGRRDQTDRFVLRFVKPRGKRGKAR